MTDTTRPLEDRFGRGHDYLRISITDRCSLRCVYCMPAEGMTFQDSSRLLSFDEIEAVVKVAARFGVSKLRLTGGEPLIRKGVEQLVRALAIIPGIQDIALTTNGLLLAEKADDLRQAGVTRVNVSLDSRKTERFAAITRGGDLAKVLKGIEAAKRVGFSPLKINVVLMKDANVDEIDDFIQWTIAEPLHVRFIEYMPIGHDDGSWRDRYVPLTVVLEKCQQLGLSYKEAECVPGNGPAQYYQIAGAKGSFGLIHPISDHFCASCNRLRLTSDGNLKPCLYWQDEFNVRPYVNDPQALQTLFETALQAKPESHEMALALAREQQSHAPTVRRMSQIGG